MLLKLSVCATAVAFALTGPAAHAEELAPGTKLPSPPGIARTVVQKSDFPGGQYATLLFIAEIAPGATVPRHTHPGLESGYVAEGEEDLAMAGEPVRHLRAGDAYQMPAGMPHTMRNTGDRPTKLVITLVYEKDKPVTSPAPE